MLESLPVGEKANFDELFRGYAGPAFAVRLWDGAEWCSPGAARPVCTLVVKDPGTLAALLAAPNEITLGEAFIHDRLDVEGDLFSAFTVAEHLFRRPQKLRYQIARRVAGVASGLGQFLRHGATNSRQRDRASIAYHYDQPVAFFQPWLGRTLAYSCGYFRDPHQALDQAQEQKLEVVCRKLRLKPDEHFLDIGCGWGSLLLHAAQWHRALARGITLSREQAETARRRIERAGMERCCSVELCDYRDLQRDGRSFDKIASVGMFEHVGLKNLGTYFGIACRLLRPGGLMLNHGIARASAAPVAGDSFINRYVFPDGRLVTLPQALEAAEQQGLEVRDVENLREHYELTLRCWVAGLRANAEALLHLVPRTTYRIWLLYMAGSAAAFRRGSIAVYQVLLSRPEGGASRMPLTREDWYAESPSGAVVN